MDTISEGKPSSASTRYANGIECTAVRELAKSEVQSQTTKFKSANRIYKWRIRLGKITFYSSLLAIALGGLFAVVPVLKIENFYVFSIFFCCLLPPIVGTAEEIIFSTSTLSRILFSLVFGFSISIGLIQGISKPSIFWWGAVLFLFFGGWIMILLRWYDAKKIYPMFAGVFRDLKSGHVEIFRTESEDFGELKLEIFPESHLIYRFNDDEHEEWERADVIEIMPAPVGEHIAPWTNAPKNVDVNDVEFYQRHMTSNEINEIVEIKKRLDRKALVSIIPSLFITAYIVRAIENIAMREMNPEISIYGWIAVFIVCLIFPLRWKYSSRLLNRDLEKKQVISAWRSSEELKPGKVLIAEILSESGLLWFSNGMPSPLRLTRTF